MANMTTFKTKVTVKLSPSACTISYQRSLDLYYRIISKKRMALPIRRERKILDMAHPSRNYCSTRKLPVRLLINTGTDSNRSQFRPLYPDLPVSSCNKGCHGWPKLKDITPLAAEVRPIQCHCTGKCRSLRHVTPGQMVESHATRCGARTARFYWLTECFGVPGLVGVFLPLIVCSRESSAAQGFTEPR